MNALAFFAHPDDETMLCGGVLALLSRYGAQVHLLSATRGEGGEVGSPPLTTPENLGQVRQGELTCAMNALGLSSLTFLGYEDPRIGPGEELFAYAQDPAEVAVKVAGYLHKFDIDAILAHGSNGEYGHPAHVLTHQAVRRAVESFKDRQILFYTVAAAFPEHPRPRLTNQDDPADLVIDVTPVLEQKTQAALCHRTQHDLFTRKASEEAGKKLTVQQVIIPVEGLHRVLPPVQSKLDDPLAELLKPFEKSQERPSGHSPG